MSADPAPAGLFAPSLVEAATRRLRDEILSGALQPGERLIEEQIRQRFSISRAPLREALRLLAQQGLVEHLPRRGARVATWSDQDIRELFELRTLLERHAVLAAFPLAGGPDVDPLGDVRRHLERMRAAQDTGDQLAKDDAHRDFHAAIVALAGNRQLDLAMEPILIKLQRPMAVNLRLEASICGPAEGLRRHEALVTALESNDADVVLQALHDHGSQRFLPLRDAAVTVSGASEGDTPDV